MTNKKAKSVVIAIIIVIIIIIGVKIFYKKDSHDDVLEPEVNQEFVEVLENGTKLNISDKLKETRKIGDYEISNIQLTEINGETQLLADVKNIGSTISEIKTIDIILYDKQGNELSTFKGLIGGTAPGETEQLNSSVTDNLANAYDFRININK